MATETLIRLPEVKARTGLSRSPIYARMREGTFPRCIKLGGKSVAWVASEVDSWISKQIANSRKDA